MIPYIQKKQKELELNYMAQVKEVDEKAKSIKKEEDILALITEFSISAGQNTFYEWKKMYSFLFTRYMDGNVKTAIEVPENYIYVEPKLEQPGYSDEWYKKLVEDTDDKFLYMGDDGH